MFHKILKEHTDIKERTLSADKLSGLKFFSKVTPQSNPDLFELAKGMSSNPDSNIKRLHIQQIRKSIQESSIAELIKYMKSDYEVIRSIAAQAFAECGSANLMNCINMMLNDPNENLRVACMESLLYMENPDSLPLLRKAMQDDSAQVRLKAAICLAELSRLSLNNEAIEILNSAIEDSDKEVREFVIDELGLIGNENSLVKILEALENTIEEEKELLNESLQLIMSRALV